MNVSPSTVFVKKHGGPILGRRMEQWSNTSDADYLPFGCDPGENGAIASSHSADS